MGWKQLPTQGQSSHVSLRQVLAGCAGLALTAKALLVPCGLVTLFLFALSVHGTPSPETCGWDHISFQAVVMTIAYSMTDSAVASWAVMLAMELPQPDLRWTAVNLKLDHFKGFVKVPAEVLSTLKGGVAGGQSHLFGFAVRPWFC